MADTRPAPVRVPEQRRATEATPETGRDPYFDNAKFLAIVLVVLGHVWANYYTHDVYTRALYLLLYTFHMPVFVFMTGYFSRGYARSADKARNLVGQVAVPFVIFNVLYRIQLHLGGVPPHKLLNPGFVLHTLAKIRIGEWFQPWFLMWFLLALLGWRLSAPLWVQLRRPVTVAVAVALIAGASPMVTDSTVSRMMGLLPFFVLGLTVRPEHLTVLRRRSARWIGAAVLALGLGAAYWASVNVNKKIHGFHIWATWLKFENGYDHLAVSNSMGMLGRFAVLALGLVMGAAFLAVIPRRRTRFTALGGATMYVFLLHGLILKTIEYQGLMNASWLQSPAGIVGVSVLAITAAVLLASTPVRRATKWIVEPNVSWLLSRKP
jgi:fucose 4-O-acetylase-like acetyltransferase